MKKQVTDKRGRKTTVWVKPQVEGKGPKKKQQKIPTKPEQKPGEDTKTKSALMGEEAKSRIRETVKNAIKGILESITQVMAGRSSGQQVGGTVEQTGEGTKSAAEAVKKQAILKRGVKK
ncbi:MAG TPA: hypothetical protein PKM65_20245 [Spirochaetota bacterium]|nr:hypothetical protein [Spirochaetota bacterium]